MTRLNRTALLGALALTPRIVASGGPDKRLPKAETILDRYIEVTGGKAAYQKHTHEKMTGTILFPEHGMTGKLTRYAIAPDKEYSSLELGPSGQSRVRLQRTASPGRKTRSPARA